ncbi:MAG: helix-turn-helix domain-containing protein [Actinomycetota bacterium]|nr:helix-turn-helix domain-containing protein [Actinomycetota bacterium]
MSILGDHLHAARRRHGATQQSLARRAGTTQAAISRIESGLESPSFERFTQLLLVLGERPVLQTAPIEHDLAPADVAHANRLPAAQRLAESASWNLVATQLEIAGARAKAQRPR